MFRGFLKREIQPESRKERNPKTQSETQGLCHHPVCLTQHSEWGLKMQSQNSPITHLGNTSTNCSSQQEQSEGLQLHLWEKRNPRRNCEWLSCGTESINVTARPTTGRVGDLSLKHKCCKAAKNREGKTVWQVHEVIPRKWSHHGTWKALCNSHSYNYAIQYAELQYVLHY